MQDLKAIFRAQKEYVNQGINHSVSLRKTHLKKLKAVIKQNESEIIDALRQDLGKSPFEVYASEISIIYAEIDYHLKHLRWWARPERRKTPMVIAPAKSYVYKDPLGVVLIIGPFNFPFQLLLSPLVGAISGGNTAILKPSAHTPAIAQLIQKLINNTFDKGFLYVLPENMLHQHEEIMSLKFDHIFFTGSTQTGRAIMQKAAENLIPVTLELGGKCPCIVDQEAKVELAAKRIVWGKFLNVGQTCVAPDHIYVHQSVKTHFLASLVNEIEKQFGRNPIQSSDYGRLINEAAVHRLASYLEGERIYLGGDYHAKDRYFSPTVLIDVKEDSKIMQEEVFGPILPVLEYTHLDQLLNELQAKETPLAMYYFSENDRNIDYVLQKTRSGGVAINDTVVQLISPTVPFGGMGVSGMGNYHGKASFDTFTHARTVVKRGTHADPNIRYAPYKDKIKLLRALFD